MNNSITYKQAQLPPNTLIVGIDPHKRLHTAHVSDAQGRGVATFQVAHTRSGLDELRTRCEALRQRQGAAGLLFAIEPGGHHWRVLAAYLTAHDQPYRLVNPLTLKRQRDGEDLQRRKNDRRDAAMAAQLVREGKYTWTQWSEGRYAELRLAYDLYRTLVSQASQLKLYLTTALDQLFPEFQRVFRDLAGATALTVLGSCPNPYSLRRLSVTSLLGCLRRRHRGQRFMVAKVRRLHTLASETIGLRDGAAALSRAIRRWAQQLALLSAQRAAAEAEVLRWAARCEESLYLRSIPGVGALTAAGLLAHIGDIRRFSKVNQLAKLAGIVPSESRSANRTARHTPMSKKGRRALRAVGHQAVVSLLRHNAVFQSYVQRLTTRATDPLTKREAMGAALNKLLRVVYSLLTHRQMFDPTHAPTP